jgi:hypothetical protein
MPYNDFIHAKELQMITGDALLAKVKELTIMEPTKPVSQEQSIARTQRGMTDIQKVKILVDFVKKREYYVPRNYQTIGGMWTTDTYERDCVLVQVMDEGYSTSVLAENLCVFILWDAKNNEDYIRFEIGNVEVVENLLRLLKIY